MLTLYEPSDVEPRVMGRYYNIHIVMSPYPLNSYISSCIETDTPKEIGSFFLVVLPVIRH